jgi:hypothetical protein
VYRNCRGFRSRRRRRAIFLVVLAALVGGPVFVAAMAPRDEPADDHVGVIDGDNLAINGPMSVESVAGQIKTVLRSGSDVRVKTGQARISLVEGGQISICGPAHLSLLKSGRALTIALDSGVIHIRVDQDPAVTVYTPLIQAKPVAIGDDPRDLLVGFESPAVMCIRTYRGAMRLEQQLSGESVMVPQGGDVLLLNGKLDTLRNGEGHCQCELQIAKSAPLPVAPPRSEAAPPAATADTTPIQVPLATTGSASDPAPAEEKPAPKDDRIYQVDMPPLVYDATAKVQPEPDPRIMIMVRRVRVRPTLIFQGRVEGEPLASPAAKPRQPQQPAAAPSTQSTSQPQQTPSFSDRVRSFFHNLWTHSP